MPPDPMPVFVLKAKDRFTRRTVRAYREACYDAGLFDQAVQVERALDEIIAWQERNPEQMKDPDHEHVPVSPNAARTDTPGEAA